MLPNNFYCRLISQKLHPKLSHNIGHCRRRTATNSDATDADVLLCSGKTMEKGQCTQNFSLLAFSSHKISQTHTTANTKADQSQRMELNRVESWAGKTNRKRKFNWILKSCSSLESDTQTNQYIETRVSWPILSTLPSSKSHHPLRFFFRFSKIHNTKNLRSEKLCVRYSF